MFLVIYSFWLHKTYQTRLLLYNLLHPSILGKAGLNIDIFRSVYFFSQEVTVVL